MMRRSWSLGCLRVVAIGTLVAAAGPGTEAAARRNAPRHAELDAATELLLVEDHRVPLVYLRIELPMGNWSRWMRESGGARAFELQLDDARRSLRSEIDALGAEVVLRVGSRAARLEASCLAEDLPDLAALVGRILRGSELDAREDRRRRREARLSWDLAVRRPVFRARRAQAELWFQPDDPRRRRYDRPAGPALSSRRAVELRDTLLRTSPRRVGFAGDVSWEQAERLARELLPAASGAVPARREPAAPLAATVQPSVAGGPAVAVSLRGATQVHFAYARDSLPHDHADYPAFRVADHVLGGHFYSRLHRALRHEGGETYAAYSVDLGDVVAGLYLLETFTRSENADVVEAKLRGVLEQFHARGITREERDAAVGFLRGRRGFARQSPQQRLDRALRELRLGLPDAFLDAVAESASRLAVEQINAFIADYFEPARFAMVRVEPLE